MHLLPVAIQSAMMMALAQSPPPAKEQGPAEPGIPVTSATVKAKCGGCHRDDGKGNLTRISWERTTPEGWQQIIKRMVRLNGVSLTAEEARDIVQALSDSHGLAPEEAAPVAWYWEKRQIHSEKLPSDTLRDSCAACHPLAQPDSWRRSKEEWTLLANMHRGYFPVVEFTSFRRPQRPGGGGRMGAANAQPAPPASPLEPFEQAMDHFAKSNPLHTPEWASWQAARREARLAGRWIVAAHLPGKGRYTGEMVIQSPKPGEFVSKSTLVSLETGERVTRTGKAVVYTSYAWRGRSQSAGRDEREVMAFSRDQRTATGRWFWGGYNEFGYDVTLHRAGDGPVVSMLDTPSLAAGAKSVSVKIHGDGFPGGLTPADLDFGSGVTVAAVTAQTPSLITATVSVAETAVPGRRDVLVRRAALPGAYAVYKTVDFITVPESALARLGGTTHPKGYFQFEALGWSHGLDGKPNTGDDFSVGPVKVKWSMEEFFARYGDDDKEYVGSLSAEGLFTPSIEGPNPKRKFETNNFGDVWVVALYQPPGASAKPLTARSYLVVTVPQYMRWDQPEVAQ